MASGSFGPGALDTSLAPASELNQCDGCRRGLPLNENGIHRGEGYDMIGCTADKYASSVDAAAQDVAEASGTK
jgi:hypothetical protein